jgi:LPXTG-motif cell wall-anchored protein
VRFRSVPAVLATAAMLALVAGGPAWAASHSVSAVDFSFSPGTLTISVGDSVTWTNNAQDPHTSTSDSGVWDSGTLNPGQSFTRTFSSAGTFAYHCSFHQSLGMVGTIVVQSSGTGGGTTGGSPLPNTGSSGLTGPFVILGLLFLVSGAFVLYRLRRLRRA